jgi:hypothetical protein
MYETKYQYDIIIIIEFNSIHSAEEKAPKTFSPPLSKPIRPLCKESSLLFSKPIKNAKVYNKKKNYIHVFPITRIGHQAMESCIVRPKLKAKKNHTKQNTLDWHVTSPSSHVPSEKSTKCSHFL